MSRGNPPRTAGARRLPFAVPAAVREIPRPELALGAGLLIGNLAFLVSRFNFAAVPPADYFSFYRVARSFADFALPGFYKRAPLYPLLIAAGRLFAPGPDPSLFAAEAWSLAAAAAVALLTYFWARRLVGRAGLLVAVIVATYSQFPLLATLPLVETVFAALILGVVVTAGRGSWWPYILAGAAAVTRYEGLALIPLALIADAPRLRSQPGRAVGAVMAALPAAVWLILSYSTSSLINPYVEEIAALPPSGLAFPREIVVSFLDSRNAAWFAAALAMTALAAWGLVRLVRRNPGARVYAGFALCYVAVHVIFPFSYRRFVFPLWPLVAASWLEGGRALWELTGRRFPRWGWTVGGAAAAALAAGLWWRLAVAPTADIAVAVLTFALPAAALAAALAWAATGANRRDVAVAALLAAVPLGLYVDAHARSYQNEYESLKTGRASLKAAAIWLKAAARPGDTVVVTDESLFHYYIGAGPELISPARFRRYYHESAARPARGGATYVCYESLASADPFGYFNKRRAATLLAPLAAGHDVGRFRLVARFDAPGERVYIYKLEPKPPA